MEIVGNNSISIFKLLLLKKLKKKRKSWMRGLILVDSGQPEVPCQFTTLGGQDGTPVHQLSSSSY